MAVEVVKTPKKLYAQLILGEAPANGLSIENQLLLYKDKSTGEINFKIGDGKLDWSNSNLIVFPSKKELANNYAQINQKFNDYTTTDKTKEYLEENYYTKEKVGEILKNYSKIDTLKNYYTIDKTKELFVAKEELPEYIQSNTRTLVYSDYETMRTNIMEDQTTQNTVRFIVGTPIIIQDLDFPNLYISAVNNNGVEGSFPENEETVIDELNVGNTISNGIYTLSKAKTTDRGVNLTSAATSANGITQEKDTQEFEDNNEFTLGYAVSTEVFGSSGMDIDNPVYYWLKRTASVPYGTSIYSFKVENNQPVKDELQPTGYGITLGGVGAAIGTSAFVTGRNSIAYGDGSCALGTNSIAYGNYSCAEGLQNLSYGKSSHAEGLYTIAYGEGCHAEGYETKAGLRKNSYEYLAENWRQYAHSEGYKTNAGGNASHAEGNSTIADGNYSHAEGSQVTANGIGAHAEGYQSKAENDYSHAEGSQTEANNIGAHAEGNGTHANGSASHAEGNSTIADGNYSHAEGEGATASGTASHAEGYQSKAENDYSHAEGVYTNAIGEIAHAEGNGTEAIGFASHAEGDNTNSNGDFSHAEGNSTIADGEGAHAEGYKTVAEGAYSHASGEQTKARGYGSYSCGILTTAATTTGQFVVGQHNAINTEALFIVGGGEITFDEETKHYKKLDYSPGRNIIEVIKTGDINNLEYDLTLLMRYMPPDGSNAEMHHISLKKLVDKLVSLKILNYNDVWVD